MKYKNCIRWKGQFLINIDTRDILFPTEDSGIIVRSYIYSRDLDLYFVSYYIKHDPTVYGTFLHTNGEKWYNGNDGRNFRNFTRFNYDNSKFFIANIGKSNYQVLFNSKGDVILEQYKGKNITHISYSSSKSSIIVMSEDNTVGLFKISNSNKLYEVQ